MRGNVTPPQFSSIFEIPLKKLDGTAASLEQFKGNVLLLVNVASRWGLTSKTYKELVEIQNRYGSRGFSVLGFPCNQFGGQEPGTPGEISAFAASKGANFPMFEKVEVNGVNAHPLYRFLRLNSSLNGGEISWNFGKFLLDRSGNIAGYYEPRVSPSEFVSDIENLL